MIIDSLLQISVGQAATGESTHTIDFNQPKPNTGTALHNMYFVIAGTEGWADGDTLDVELLHSDSETSGFTVIAKSGAQAFGVGKQIILPMPIQHKRYVKASYTATGTGGKVDAQVVTGLQLNIVHPESERVAR